MKRVFLFFVLLIFFVAALRELESDQPDSDFMQSLRDELENKNKLLTKAK